MDLHFTAMDSAGRFHVEEVDGKRSLVYSPIIFLSEPAIDSGETDGLLSQTLFLCPTARIESARRQKTSEILYAFTKLDSSPLFHGVAQQIECADDYNTLDRDNHYVLPLFWCNNEKEHWSNLCGACGEDSKVSEDFYLCAKYGGKFHKKCVESPVQINHPLHPKHPLQLWSYQNDGLKCFHCKEKIKRIFYRCIICKFGMHPVCAMEPVSCVIEKCKRHVHPLTIFTSQASLDCNVCGLISDVDPTYACLQCNFVAHSGCVDSPHVIRISRHQHRISFALSLPPGNQSCGVCRQKVNREYGGYTCNKCDDYIVHSKCALRMDVWDGEEIQGVPEDDDIEEVIEPFKRINDGTIIHFSHQHLLRLETSRVYDDNKICDACVIRIYEGDFYSCGECDFILHDTCANAPTRKRHPLHPHPLTLRVINGGNGFSICVACNCRGSGFIYQCKKKGCDFYLDVRCASISEPFYYQGHEHPLFLALDPGGEKKSCQVCQKGDYDKKLLNCIECDYIICFKCVTIPYMARYKHDKHFLTLGFEDETSKPDWCEVCEKRLTSSRQKERFYTCNHCCTTLHIKCLLGEERYLKPGRIIDQFDGIDIKILPNNSFSRPICDVCGFRCVDKIIYQHDNNETLLTSKKYYNDMKCCFSDLYFP